VTSLGDEIALTFACAGDALIGVLHLPALAPTVGVVIVVGGPQYRVGSHRQFLLLARSLAAQGIAALRFDCRGMGDSDGAFPGFEHIEPDVASAVDAMMLRVPSLRHVVLWGLCDANSAMAEHARRDARIAGVVLLNPWVRSESSLARTQLKHYYLARLMQPDFLRKVLTGRFNPIASMQALLGNIVRAFGSAAPHKRSSHEAARNALAERMAAELERFKGRVLIILSGRDLTAKEFADAARSSTLWQKLYADARVTRRDFPAADHTFSRRAWRDQVAEWTRDWLKSGMREAGGEDATPEASRAHSGNSSSV
jgi:exosortase A-associated hydrolase 1